MMLCNAMGMTADSICGVNGFK